MKDHLIERRYIDERSGGGVQSGFPLCESGCTLAIELLSRLSKKPFHGRTKNDLQTIGSMIDGGDNVVQTELQIRQLQIVFSHRGERFKFTHEVVAEVADCSTKERRQAWRRLNLGIGK